MRVLFTLLFLITACAAKSGSGDPSPSACRDQLFEGSRFTVCDPGSGELRLVAAGPNQQPLRSFAAVAARIHPDRVLFAMNAGMFNDQGRPLGWAVVEGRQVHRLNRREGGGNFHLMPNGVFLVRRNGRPAVLTSERAAELKETPRFATQSGPMLLIEGKLHQAFDRDGSSRLVRNGVGVTAAGKALFVISDDPVSFGKLARLFRDRLHTPNALYFDGAVSSLWDPANGREDSHSPLGPMVIVLKPAASAPGRASRARP